MSELLTRAFQVAAKIGDEDAKRTIYDLVAELVIANAKHDSATRSFQDLRQYVTNELRSNGSIEVKVLR